MKEIQLEWHCSCYNPQKLKSEACPFGGEGAWIGIHDVGTSFFHGLLRFYNFQSLTQQALFHREHPHTQPHPRRPRARSQGGREVTAEPHNLPLGLWGWPHPLSWPHPSPQVTKSWPHRHALCKGCHPSDVLASTSAPRLNRVRTTSSCPL